MSVDPWVDVLPDHTRVPERNDGPIECPGAAFYYDDFSFDHSNLLGVHVWLDDVSECLYCAQVRPSEEEGRWCDE